MTIYTKICGLSNAESVNVADECGVAYVGFVFYKKSPRYITPKHASNIVSDLSKTVIKVAVMVNPSDEYIQEILKDFTPDYIQLHGDESVDRVEDIKLNFGIPVIKAFSVSSKQDIKNAMKYINAANIFLFDSKLQKDSTNSNNLPGGNGISFDWNILSSFEFEIPVFLSGGININNVSEAVTKTCTKMVDVSSGVESSLGVKDIIKIRQFMTEVNKIEA